MSETVIAPPQHSGVPSRQPRRRRWWVLAAIAALVVAVAVTATVVTSRTQEEPEDAAPPPPVATARVGRRDIQRRDSFEGRLGYGDTREPPLVRAGTITRLPEVGDVLVQGEGLAWVDATPLILLDGELPAWRDLHRDMTNGPDVRQLEAALVALGHARDAAVTGNRNDLVVDQDFTAASEKAIKTMQKALGLSEDGRLDLGEVLFTPGPVRVAERLMAVGDLLDRPQAVLSLTDTERIVTAELEASDRDLVIAGMAVEVELPDGRTATGTVRSIGTNVDTGDGDGQGGDQGQGADQETIEVIVALADAASVEGIDQAPVDVNVTIDMASDVLAVPVTALVATPDGHAVDRVIPGGSMQRIPVEARAFGDGWVEIRGDLEEGDEVAVPS